MMRYIVDRSNLRIIMGLLRHNQPNIQFEAFHVFKVRAAGQSYGVQFGVLLRDETCQGYSATDYWMRRTG
jgi:calcium binding protein 39